MNAQSTQSRYINPSTSTYLKTSLYASTMQEKTKYMSCFTVQGLVDKDPTTYYKYLDDQLDFYPTLVVQASNISNASQLALTFEVTYNVTFRGASTIASSVQDTSGYINPETEMAMYVMPKVSLNLDTMNRAIKPGTLTTLKYEVKPGDQPDAAKYVGSTLQELQGQKAASSLALQIWNPSSTQRGGASADSAGNGLPKGYEFFEGGLLGDVPVYASDYVTQMATNSQNIRVDGSLMNDGNGNISAIGYVDTCLNVDDSNESLVQDNGSSNRIGWQSINGVTQPADLREANIALTGPQYVSTVPETFELYDINSGQEQVWFWEREIGSPDITQTMIDLWTKDEAMNEELWSNLPMRMGDSGNYNYNSRYADNLKVVISRVTLWKDQFENETSTTDNLLTINPNISEEEGSSCFIVYYELTNDVINGKYRMEMIPQYTGGPINIDMYRGIVDLIMGNTFAPMTFKQDQDFNGFIFSPLNLSGGDNMQAFMDVMQMFSTTARGYAMYQGVVWNRIKGFFRKIVRTIPGVVRSLVKPLNVVASVLPGPAGGVIKLVTNAASQLTTEIQAVCVSNSDAVQADGEGDAFILQPQVYVHSYRLDGDYTPIDAVSSDAAGWANVGDPIRVPATNVAQTIRSSSAMNFETEGMFSERVGLYRANNAPMAIQSRVKVMFDKTNVPIDYKAMLVLGTENEFEQ